METATWTIYDNGKVIDTKYATYTRMVRGGDKRKVKCEGYLPKDHSWYHTHIYPWLNHLPPLPPLPQADLGPKPKKPDPNTWWGLLMVDKEAPIEIFEAAWKAWMKRLGSTNHPQAKKFNVAIQEARKYHKLR